MVDMELHEIQALLESAIVGRLGMIDTRGRPYTSPLRFVWTGQHLFVRLGHDGRKGEALEKCKYICFETDDCRNDFSHYASVVVEGTISDVTDEEEKRAGLVAFNAKYTRLCGLPNPGDHPVTNGVALRKILVERMTGRKREPDQVETTTRRRMTRGISPASTR